MWELYRVTIRESGESLQFYRRETVFVIDLRLSIFIYICFTILYKFFINKIFNKNGVISRHVESKVSSYLVRLQTFQSFEIENPNVYLIYTVSAKA